MATISVTLLAPPAAAQSLSKFAAWDALMLTPVGALPAIERGDAGELSPGWGFAGRYGRWRYDSDDAIHNDAGFSASHALAGRVDVSLTGAFLSLSCGTCPGWVSGGLQARLPLLQRRLGAVGDDPVTGSIGFRGDVGVAHYLGEGGSNARSISGTAALSLAIPTPLGGRLAVTVLPGIGGGRVVSVDETAQDTLPIIGATVAWIFRAGLAVHAGIQRIVIDGGPSQLGVGLSWAGR